MKSIKDKIKDVNTKFKSILDIPVIASYDDTDVQGLLAIQGTELKIKIFINNIQFHFRSDHKFYGLQPKTSAEAMQLVLEHEYVHAIMILIFESEYLGHNEIFLYLAKHLFGHESMVVE